MEFIQCYKDGVMNLNRHSITEFPMKLLEFKEMEVLDLSCNKLTSIPKEIGQLINLQKMFLSGNKLTSIPKEIGQLVNLQRLYLTNNKLTSIPPEIGQLINLQKLSLSCNKLTSIPPEIEQLINLQQLWSSDIHGELNITFGELLVAVWDRIRGHSNKENILPILSQEMTDASCMCFSGKFMSLVNSLSGFVPEVEIKISDNKQISILFLVTKYKIIHYNSDEHKSLFSKEMKERGYSQEIITEWLSYYF